MTDKKDMLIYYIRFCSKKPEIKSMTLSSFLKQLNDGLKSKDQTRKYNINDVWYHKRQMVFGGLYKFYTTYHEAEKVFKKLNW